MAGGCFAIFDTGSSQYLRAADDTNLSFDTQSLSQATAFFMKATALGRYLFYSPDEQWLSLIGDFEGSAEDGGAASGSGGNSAAAAGDFIALVNPVNAAGEVIRDGGEAVGEGGATAIDSINANRSFRLADAPNNGADWIVDEANVDSFLIQSFATGESMAVLTADGASERFQFHQRGGCTEYPEAQLNATGEPFKGTLPDGSVFGYAETHMHLGGSEALGGRISYGEPYNRFGIVEALKNCAEDHGVNGEQGILDIAVDSNTTVPNHDTLGWPTFNDWPTYSSQTHHQTYYIWLKRAWLGGLRFMVNHLVANEMLCLVYPTKEHDCNEMESARIQLALVEGLQDYIDAQEGGPGKGFFRIVYTPAEARAVIEDGKMAVINGTEMEKVFDCGEYLDSPECSEAQIEERMTEWYDMGLRAIFPIHIFDNAFGGSEIARFTKDPPIMNLYNQGNFVETGHYYATVPCSQAEAIDHGEAETEDRDLFGLLALQITNGALIFGGTPITGCQNNARTLTTRGDYFINRLIDYGIIIETDHTGPLARKRMLDIALQRGAPVVSGHTGSISVARDSKRILETGGIISILSDDPRDETIGFINDLKAAYQDVFGTIVGLSTGFGADINGIHPQPDPRPGADTDPLVYPFQSYDGNILFDQQVTGERVFDVNVDGVAHYGLYPDYIADIQQADGGPEVLEILFKSAEGYLRVWEQAHALRTE